MVLPVSLNEYKMLETLAERENMPVSRLSSTILSDKKLFTYVCNNCHKFAQHIRAYKTINMRIGDRDERIMSEMAEEHAHSAAKMYRLILMNNRMQSEYYDKRFK